MIILSDKSLCCGCAACAAICSASAIRMEYDAEGFAYPQVDNEKCKGCRKCQRVCPVLNQGAVRYPKNVYAAKAKDVQLRMESSSGAVFSLLAQDVLRHGGVVVGAAIEYPEMVLVHRIVRQEADLKVLRGSKYVQSDIRGVYEEVKKLLRSGVVVLFSGTPCQVSAIKHYIGKDCENLLCIEVICHAVPSPLAWRRYLEEKTIQSGRACPIDGVSFRDKRLGWKRFSLSIHYADGTEQTSPLDEDSFMSGFLSELFNRPSCHKCANKQLRSGADLTLGDYWNISRRFPEMDDDRGTSLVVVNTERGWRAYDRIRPQLFERECDYAQACSVNGALVHSTEGHISRSKFFKCLNRGERFGAAVSKCREVTLRQRTGIRVRRALDFLVKKGFDL